MDYLNQHYSFSRVMASIMQGVLCLTLVGSLSQPAWTQEEEDSEALIFNEAVSKADNISKEDDVRGLESLSTSEEEVVHSSSLSREEEESRSSASLLREEEGRSPSAVSKQALSANAAKIVVLPPGVEEKYYDGVSKVEGTSLARRKIIEEATLKISEEMVQSMIGEARFKKNKPVIADKIFKRASRYIPVIKTGDLIKVSDGQKLTVTLQVNSKILETMLQEQGLLYDNETAPMIMPFLVIDDQVNRDGFRWWRTGNSLRMQSLNDYLEKQMQSAFFSSGFFIQRPEASQLQMMVPAFLQQEFLSPEQIQNLSKRWNVPITLMGDLLMRPDANSDEDIVIELRLMVTQVSSGRVLAQLSRQSKIPKSETLGAMNLKKNFSFVVQAFKDLTQQMKDAWQKGFLSSTLVRLEVQGPLTLGKYDLFKSALKTSNRSIRQVKERLITSKSVYFELAINGSVNDLVSGFKPVSTGDRTYKFKGVDADGKLLLSPE